MRLIVTEVNNANFQRLSEERNRLLADFIEYGNHKFDCAGGDGERCACGYLDAWAKVSISLKDRR